MLVPEPVQLPEVVIATGKPEVAVAPTVKLAPNAAEAGAFGDTLIVCAALAAAVVSVTCGAAK